MSKIERRLFEHSPINHRHIQRTGRAMIFYGGIFVLFTLLSISCGSKISTSTVVPTCNAQATVSAEVRGAEKLMTQMVVEGREDVARELAAAMTDRPSQNYACKPTTTEKSVIFQTETSTPVPAFKQTGVALTMDAILATLTPLDYTNYTPAPGIEETMWKVRGDILTSTAKAEVTSQP